MPQLKPIWRFLPTQNGYFCHKGYQRVRIGIGRPEGKEQVTGYVLGNFAKAEHEPLERVLDGLAQAAPFLARNEAEAFMTKVAVLCGEKAPDGL